MNQHLERAGDGRVTGTAVGVDDNLAVGRPADDGQAELVTVHEGVVGQYVHFDGAVLVGAGRGGHGDQGTAYRDKDGLDVDLIAAGAAGIAEVVSADAKHGR